jgi:hypothetical protein
MKRLQKRKVGRQKKETPVGSEIRIANPEQKIYETIKSIAENEKRGIGKQSELFLKKYLEQNKLM